MKRSAGPRQKRQRSYRRGRMAEWRAVWWLRLKGYRIVDRNFKVPVGEIDLVARRGAVLAFVEVKARTSLGAAGMAITPRQQSRIIRAAGVFLQQNPGLSHLAPRFDALLLCPGHWPRHETDAWRLP